MLHAVQKADKEHLDAKVNCNHFEATYGELNDMISRTFDKLLGTVCCTFTCLHCAHISA